MESQSTNTNIFELARNNKAEELQSADQQL
jgi:hypothetical protein